jgi:hypothetical protein
MEGEKIRSALEAVRISSDLIAFYPQPLRRTQPYVILLNPASGIFKRLDLGDAKQGFCSTSQRLVA